MGLKKFQIVFDNPWSTYYTGQPVTGRVLLSVDSPKKVRGIVIHIKGEANVHWSETEARSKPSTPAATGTATEGGNTAASSGGTSLQPVTVNYDAHESYFENKFNIIGGTSGEVELPAGELSYPFATHLPPNLPSSFEGEHGHIRYTVKAVLDRPWKFDQEAKAAFTVICPLDLNTHPTAKDPIKKEESKTFGFCCWKSGPLNMTLSLPVGGYVPGQDIPVTVDIENGSDIPIREVKCTLRKLLTFTVTRPSKSTKKDDIVIGELILGEVGAHATQTLTQMLKIPSLPPSNLNNCSIIDLEYEMKVKAKPASKWHFNLMTRTPIILGTVPLASYQPPVAPPQEKPAGEINGGTDNVSGETGGIHPPTGPAPDTGDPGAGWNMPPSDPNVQPPAQSLYPNLPAATYSESMFGPKNIKDAGDNQYTHGNMEYAPMYPVFNFENK